MIRSSVIAAAIVAGLLQPAAAQGTKPAIEVTDAWARAMPPGARTGAVYVTLANKGTSDDQLVGASTPVAAKAQLHTTITDNGVMKMRPLAKLDVKPGASVTFKPGGMHVMLLGVSKRLAEGQSFPLTLDFAKAGKIETTVRVEKVGAMTGMEMGGPMKGMNMGTGGTPQK